MTDQDLSNLVRDRRAELRLSLRAVEDRTRDDTGEPAIKYGWLNKLEKGHDDVTPPTRRQLRALAEALELPPSRVQEGAASQFFGVQVAWSSSGEARAFALKAERLTPAERDALRHFLDTFTPQDGPATDG